MNGERRARILVVEDDPRIRKNVVEFLSEEGFDVLVADNGADGIALAKARTPDLVLCDIMLPKVDGYGVLEEVRQSTRYLPFIFLTAKAERVDVRAGMNLGADDYLTKPFTLAEVLEAVRTRLGRADEVALRARVAVAEETEASRRTPVAAFGPEEGVVVTDPGLRAIYDQAGRIAPFQVNVLILGERGVGKEILARAVHNLSPRGKGPFLALNCAALNEPLLESELFGNEKGAFTGATQAREGLFEAASGGTVFLDEVAELPASIQAKLLRVIEERRVLRVGGRSARAIDVRFVAATNRDLETQASRGAFREDLYDRLNGISFTIPPLRVRGGEIGPLSRMFVARACAEFERPATLGMAPELVCALERYDWPGNVRELKNVIERAVLLCEGDTLRLEDLPAKVRADRGRAPSRPDGSEAPHSEAAADPFAELRKQKDELERQRIKNALDLEGGNQTRAAKRLGIARRTLLYQMKDLGIPGPRTRKVEVP
jgi:DNA-binding NtrC family response regulator